MDNLAASSINPLPSQLDNEGNSAAKGSKRAISDDPLSNSCHALVHDWIKECEANHVVCNSERPEEFPKRLIDVGNENCIKLCPTEIEPQYIALSHCWGNGTPLKTTRANEMERESSIPWEKLPRSYQDAVKVTRWLGMRYLWIDSLCILQDDPDDWEKESAKMAGIYSGSYLVVAASRASSSDEGFLQYRDSTYKTGSDYFFRSNHDSSIGTVESQLADCPLLQRGWCFQERMLASRVLHFAPLELIFHCRIGRKCECSTYDRGRGKYTQHSYYMAYLNPSIPVSPSLDSSILQGRTFVDQKASKALQHRFRSFKAKIYDIYLRGKDKVEFYDIFDPPKKPVRFGEMWGDIVSDYTRLKFTFDRDILSAFSGFANLTQAFSPGRYVAGLWEKDLHYQLAWESIMEEEDCYRPSDYLAPSFSWASRIGQVTFPFERIITGVCTIVEIQATPKGADPFGRVKDGHIKLRGKMICRLVTKDSLGWWRIFNEGQEEGSLVFDTTEDEAEMGYGTLHCFDLFREQIEGDDLDAVTALALHYCEIDDTFRRVGVASMLPAYWFDSVFEREIIIV